MSLNDHPRKAEALDALAWDLAGRFWYEADIEGYGWDSDNESDVAHFYDLGLRDATRHFETIANALEETR